MKQKYSAVEIDLSSEERRQLALQRILTLSQKTLGV